MEKVKVVILAGGFGTRISEYTKVIPKPLIKIDKMPIIHHIINIYKKFGFYDFLVATGYKGNMISDYFSKLDLNIQCVNTGTNVMTGGRLKRLEKYLSDTFFLTYGDGLANVNIKKVLQFHNKNKRICTVTAVRPPARFGEIRFGSKNFVKSFKEKPQTSNSWINGGFFVMNKKILKFIKNDSEVLEGYPLEKLSKINELCAYKHNGFWHCIDTVRDKNYLEEVIQKNKRYPWV